MKQVRMASRRVDNDQVFKSNNIPTAKVSEKKIETEAPLAIRVLERMGALDMLEPLGLTPHYKENV